MAQLITGSFRITLLYQPLSVRLWKVSCRTSFTGCGQIICSPHGEFSKLLPSTTKNPQIETTRLFCTTSPLNTKTDDGAKFNLIYKFPAIRFWRTVSRLKLLQTALTILFLPPVYYYYLQGQITDGSVIYCTGIAIFAGIMLYSLSYYLQRLIGMVYVDDNLTTVKVSYLTFWGNRKNIFVPIADIKPLSETGDSKQEILRQFARYSTPDILYFTTRYGYVLDRKKFIAVFGELE
ncbi:transmembrane protein 186 [Eleutherodactylus coqui]|uniref:transmembrane protein 186 n=1 Tax=Eleutherodactylus coqui TaxID=57060 RepID=UPI003462FEA4